MKEPVVSKLLRITLYIIFVLGAVLIVTLPFLLEYYISALYDVYYLASGYRVFIVCFLDLQGVLGLWIVAEMIRMLGTIPTDPFVARNTLALRRIGIVALVMAFFFFVKCALYITYLTLGCGILLVICSLFAFTLSSLFRQAVAFKEENELTI